MRTGFETNKMFPSVRPLHPSLPVSPLPPQSPVLPAFPSSFDPCILPPVRPSVRPSLRLSICSSIHPSIRSLVPHTFIAVCRVPARRHPVASQAGPSPHRQYFMERGC